MQLRTLIAIVVVVLLGLSIWWFAGSMPKAEAPSPEAAEGGSFAQRDIATPVIRATYRCEGDKIITAGFSDDGIVALDLSDGRSMTLEQTISASGARYANEGEAFVFWNKGTTAFVEEEGTTTFADCVEEKPEPEVQ